MSISAKSVRLDDASMWVELSDGRTIGVPFAWFPSLLYPTQCGTTFCQAMHEGWTQTEREAAHARSRLKPTSASGRPHLTSQPSSRTGENPPYGMIGGIMETSASFEARSAP